MVPAFLTAFVKVILFSIAIVLGIFTGKKLREKKNNKQQMEDSQK